MYNPIEEKRRLVQERIAKSFNSGINLEEEMSLEKAKYQVGEPHPNNPNILWTEWRPGKFDWKSKNGRYWKGKAGASTTVAASGNKTMSSANEKTWDKLDDFNKKGSDENNLWNSWYKYQKSGDPMHVSTFRNILEKKFPKVAEWKQTSPNTGKAVITAKDSDGNDIASIDLSGDNVTLSKLQTFMDKCYDISKKDTGITGNSIDGVWDDKAGGYKTEPFKGAAKVDSLKEGDKLQTKSGKIYTIKSVNDNANNTVDIVINNGSKIGGGVFTQTYNKSGYIGATKVDDKKNTTSKTQSPQDKVKDIMQQFDDTTMDEDEFDEYVDSVLGNDMGQKLRKQILESNKSFSDKRQAYEDAVESHLGLKHQKYSNMDIKDAKKALVGKVVTLKDYWPDGRGGSQDAVGEIKNVRLYGKDKLPIAEISYLNGDEQMIRLDEIDDGKMKDSYKTPIVVGDDKTHLDAVKKKIANNSDPRDKIAHDAGFKDYEEMKGYQDYVTQKYLLKKRSTKGGTRLLFEKEVAKYEKDHAELIKKQSNKK